MNTPYQQALLVFVRHVVANELGAGASPEPPTGLAETADGGAFVTLKRGRRLRGCMGTLAPKGSLVEILESVARSACRDPRFESCPVAAAELGSLTIEVSLLSPAVPVADRNTIEVGRHGILIRRGGQSGCFLPQVAVERGWTAAEFLTQCCVAKAHLPAEAWRDPSTEVLVFSAEVFSDR